MIVAGSFDVSGRRKPFVRHVGRDIGGIVVDDRGEAVPDPMEDFEYGVPKFLDGGAPLGSGTAFFQKVSRRAFALCGPRRRGPRRYARAAIDQLFRRMRSSSSTPNPTSGQ